MLSFPHSLGSNALVGLTDYVNKSEVQGSSFEVGAKVTYEGREMTVSRAPDIDGDIRMIDLSGFMALAASLPECGLTSLECAAPKYSPLCQRLPLLSACLFTRALAVWRATTSVPKEEPPSLKGSRATQRCECSSKPTVALEPALSVRLSVSAH